MKKWFLHILLLAGLFGVLTTSCSQEEFLEEVTGRGEKEKVTVCFSIAMNGTESRSRASWNNNDNPKTGVGFENDIDFSPENFEVKLTLVQNEPALTVQNIAYWETANENVYEFVGEVEIANPSPTPYTNAKVEIFANIGKDQREYEVNYTKYPARGVEYIPMWGVHTFDNLSLIPGERNPLGTINLLRAMSKIEVNLDPSLISNGYSIEGASLDKYNYKGNILPLGTSGNTEDFDMDGCFNPYTIVAISDGIPFQVQENSDNSYVIYVPEYNNLEGSEDDLNIQAFIYKNDEPIYPELSSRGVFPVKNSIVRNHWYVYTITKVNDKIEVGVQVSVKPWDIRYPDLEI